MEIITANTHTFVKETEERLARELRGMELRLTIRLGCMMVVAVGAVAVLVKLL